MPITKGFRALVDETIAPGCVHAPRGMLEFWVDPAEHHEAAKAAKTQAAVPAAQG